MPTIRVANAPCSWGALEFDGLEGQAAGYAQVLDEMAETGYQGTEFGDWGFMPTEPAALRSELESRALTMVGAFVPVPLRIPAAHPEGVAHALKTARLLSQVASPDHKPFLVLADENGTDPVRTTHAGRITPHMGLSPADWRVFALGAESVARTVLDETGLPTVFHHHCGGYVETPAEIAQFLDHTKPELIGLVLDTGHYVYGAGGAGSALDALDQFGGRSGGRIRHVHFKDCDPEIARQAAAQNWDYFEAVRQGLFCELGKGSVDFPAVLDWMKARNTANWIVVEQDVLPGMGSPKQSAQRNRDYLKSIGV